MSRILSLLNLAYRFNLHQLKKPFASDVPGKQRFLESYGPDGLVPLDERARARLPSYEGCLSCGLCDAMCGSLAAARRHLFNGPSDLATSLSRDFTAFPRLLAQLDAWGTCADCTRCEAVCPTGVPLRELAAFVRALAEAAAGERETSRGHDP
jgi:succinate dehydrogenase/fumarate reductase-like Fe-S protein